MANQIQTSWRLVKSALMAILTPVAEGRDGAKGVGRSSADVILYFENKYGSENGIPNVPFVSIPNGHRGFMVSIAAPNYADVVAEFQAWHDAGIAWNDILVQAGLRKATAQNVALTPAQKAENFLRAAFKTDTKDGRAPNLLRLVSVKKNLLGERFKGLSPGVRSELFGKLYEGPLTAYAQSYLANLSK